MRLCLSVIAFLVLRMCILVVSRYDGLMVCLMCYYREYSYGVVPVIQWILTEHYQEGSVSEELLKEMLFWSCRYVHTLVPDTNTYMYMYVLMVHVYAPATASVCIHL